ncbi:MULTISPECIES: peptidase domain-containing ABC transporter [Bacillus cereus group]|uniref:peptidase domain-containing ABC transporter n=1 Tax=Bacillus cereus group TaxID=86661 RepID=UPI0007B6D963|nr:peptidase domain-containing ABC transporter [Bacillus cereus]ANC11237.1 peptidase C39 [Bacillus cereus]ANC16998.1 peptidase C39 [Bacillus cereus]MDA1997244.1 peptidase domain-containing ABC transporter [Bacillus cereus]MDA2003091.1 peptidase domain-containing ABC transporter [Bacillus cereus]MDA3655586.1 peptidase domain-containing ABC transporter [Bacillus cereus]
MNTKVSSRRKVPFIEQVQQTECGICCIAMIAAYYKSAVSFYELHEYAGSGRDGTNLLALKQLGKQLGFNSKCFKSSTKQLENIQLPAVVFWENKHYVVLEKITKKGFVIVDPAMGRRKLSYDQFNNYYSGYVMTCKPTEKFKRQKEKNLWFPLIKTFFKNTNLVIFIILSSLILQGLALGIPNLIQFIIDKVITPQEKETLELFLIGIIIVVMVQAIFTFIRGRILIRLENYLDKSMMQEFFYHVLKLPYKFFQLRSFGDILFRIGSLRAIRDMISSQIIKSILDLGLIIFIFGYMMYQSVILTGLVLIITTLNILLTLISKPLIKEANQNEITKSTVVQGIQTETLYGIFGVKMTGMENVIYKRWLSSFEELLKAYKRKGNILNYVTTIGSTLAVLSPLMVLWLGAHQVFSGILTLGGLISFYAIANQFFSLSNSILQTYNSFVITGSYLKRVRDVLDTPVEYNTTDPIKFEKLKGEIQLRNVSFSYTKYSEKSLNQINLHIKPGQKVALVGKSGSGKSTLARVILGLHEPTEGYIQYDGHDLNKYDKSSLRKNIGVVPQDVTLFNRTIYDNISLNNPEINSEMIVKAAKIAQVHEEIIQMPMQYNTIVSEMGMNISGGQRQRIALARAFVYNPSILVLDEATSSLDHVNEEKIDNYLSEIRCTRIVISHRLTTIMNSDLIVVMDNGEIIESGTHDELINTDGYYSQFFNKFKDSNEEKYITLQP